METSHRRTNYSMKWRPWRRICSTVWTISRSSHWMESLDTNIMRWFDFVDFPRKSSWSSLIVIFSTENENIEKDEGQTTQTSDLLDEIRSTSLTKFRKCFLCCSITDTTVHRGFWFLSSVRLFCSHLRWICGNTPNRLISSRQCDSLLSFAEILSLALWPYLCKTRDEYE